MFNYLSKVLIVILVVAFAWTYYEVLRDLLYDWANDDNFSHGFLILPLASYFIWRKRDQLKLAVLTPSFVGLIFIFISLIMLIAGRIGAEGFTTRLSILVFILGTILFMLGANHLKLLLFPVLFMILMIPWPSLIFNKIAFPLQLLASIFGEMSLHLLNIPVMREGNILILPNIQLEVAEACSGLRSLVSLLTIAIVYGYFYHHKTSMRLFLTLAMIPIAVLANAVRVAGTGAASFYFGPDIASGFLHTFSGWLVFVFSTIILLVVDKSTRLLLPLFKIQFSNVL
jgi:exosortase